MRKITKEFAIALKNNVRKADGNTTCTGTSVFLHGNEIARVMNGRLEISLAGWPTVTTRERLNGILAEFGCWQRVSQIKGNQWLGERIISETAWISVN